MLVGHLAAGMLAKRVEPRLSLGTAVLGAMAADFLWCAFLLAGIEQVQYHPGVGAANYLTALNIAWSHSLLTNALWAALLGSAYFLIRRQARAAWVLAAAVLSHWLLDVVAHRPDMALAPGVHLYLGLGLWTSVPATLAVEGGFWVIALVAYARTARPSGRLGSYVLWIGAALLTLVWYLNIAGPPPRHPETAPVSSLIFFSLVVAWAYWTNRLRRAQA